MAFHVVDLRHAHYYSAAAIVKTYAISRPSGVPSCRSELYVRLIVCGSEERPGGRDRQQRAGQQGGGKAESPLDNVLIGVDDPCPRRRSRQLPESCAGELDRDPRVTKARQDKHQDERERCRLFPRA